MSDAYQFEDTGDADSLARYVQKLRSNLKSRDAAVKCLKSIAILLEALPQDVSSLGSARDALEQVLMDRSIVGSKHKDVRTFAAACMAHMLRIYAPETPYEDSQLRNVFDLLLWSVRQLADYQSPMFETALSVVQTINQTRSYFLLLDLGAEDAVLEWVRALLQSINAGSSAMAGTQVMELLQGLIDDESTNNAVLEVLLSHLVPPRSLESPHACEVAQAVLKACEADVKPQLQKYLTTLILSPISSNSDLQHQCYTLIYQLYQSIPHVLLPVVPHLTSELQSSDGTKRLEAVQLLSKLFSLPGSKLVTDYGDVLDALLGRYQDTKMEVRLTMLESANALVAGVGSEDLQQKVLKTAATRLQDFEEKVRVAAVKSICQTSRRLLVGPTSAAPGSTGPAADHANQLLLTTPPGELLGQLGSQEDDAAEAADLGVEYTPPDAAVAGAGLEAQVKDVAYVHEVLQRVSLRLRDTKATVRKTAANGLLAIFRAVAAAGDADQLAKVCWLPNRIILCMKSDAELRTHIVESAMKDGLLGPQIPVAQTAAAWVKLWLTASQLEREALLLTLNLRARAQGEALVFLTLRRKASGKDKDDSDSMKQRLETAAKRLAQCLPQPDKAMEGLNALMAVRDNHVFTNLQQALSPDVTLQAFTKARSDALARVGSRSSAADFISHLLLWARPGAWLPTAVLSAMLELIAGDPNGSQGDLVRGAYGLMQKLAKTAALLFAGLMPQLLSMLHSNEADLQLLSTHLLARCFVQQRKLGLPAMTASSNEATASLVKKQLMPCLRQLARGQICSAEQRKAGLATATNRKDGLEVEDTEEQVDGFQMEDSPVTAANGVAAPKAAKWAVYALATCQDSSSCRKELSQLAVELAGSLDSSQCETAAKLQALSAIGRILPDAFAPHVETLMSFVLDDYLLSYLDASITNPTGISLSPSSRSPVPLGIPGESSLDPELTGSQAPGAAAVWLKAGAIKALAAGCVPDSDSSDLPMEMTRAVARLAPRLEGYLEPGEDARPEFLADVSAEVAGVLRLAAASALLRLARRHDSRMNSSCYGMLALVMQDDLEGVRSAFSTKVYKLMRHFQVRPSTHQLGAKYAAMLPLGAMDPSRANKEAAGRQLREWVHSRRAAVQQQITAAAAAADGNAKGGGSTLQDLPEMVIPYGLYILAHHPDFPQDEDADEAQSYDPFQFMLQFMLQPLLVASGSTPAGATIPAIVKMCQFLKKTADISEDACTNQLYVLCDMTAAIVKGLAEAMNLDSSLVSGHYPGSITLPKGLYRPLDKDERSPHGVSYLPPAFQVTFDPEPAAALAHPSGQAAAQTAAAGKGKLAGAGSKRRAQQHRTTAVQLDANVAAAGGHSKAGRRAATKRAYVESDDGWESDEGSEDAPPSAQKAAKDQHLTKRQHVLQQQQQRGSEQQPPAQDASGKKHKLDPQQQAQNKHKRSRQLQEDAVSGDSGSHEEQQQESEPSQPLEHPQAAGRPSRQHKQAHGKQQQNGKLKQQPLTAVFHQAGTRHIIADASSPAPAKHSRGSKVSAPEPPLSPFAAAAGSASAGGSAADESAEEGNAGDEAAFQNGIQSREADSQATGADEDSEDSQAASARRRHSSRAKGAAPGKKTTVTAARKRSPAKSGRRAKGGSDLSILDQQPNASGRATGRGARSGAAAGAAKGTKATAGSKRTAAPAASGGARTTRRRAANA